MTNKLVSILIPLYNSENFISETIESCLNQTYKNIEIIIVDDHSSDNSFSIAQSYREKYPEIISVYTNPKKGACAARNYAFERSKGNYIQYLDADDILPNKKLEKQISLLADNENATLTCSWSHFWNDISEAKFNPLHIYQNYDIPEDLLIDMIKCGEMLTSHAWLTPRNVVIKSGKWDEDLIINQDGEFFSRIILNSKKIKYSSENMVLYRQNTGTSITRSGSTYAKAKSELNSLHLITNNILYHKDNKLTKAAAATLWERYIIKYVDKYDDLTGEAVTQRLKIKETAFHNNHSLFFKTLINIAGIKNAGTALKIYRNLKTKISESSENN